MVDFLGGWCDHFERALGHGRTGIKFATDLKTSVTWDRRNLIACNCPVRPDNYIIVGTALGHWGCAPGIPPPKVAITLGEFGLVTASDLEEWNPPARDNWGRGEEGLFTV